MIFIAVLFLPNPLTVSAHGFGRYVSTPVSPPIEFAWWLPIGIGLLWLGSYVIMRKVLKLQWRVSVALSLISLIAFAIPFYLYGLAASRFSTAPPVGIGVPCSTFWGFGWPEAGGTFVWWNLKGYGLFLVVLMLCGGIRQTWHRFPRVLIVSAVAYLLSLIPFFLTGALLHGWCGGYVQNACQDRLNVLSLALCDYADAHNGLLPEVSDMKSLLDALKPYTATNMDHIRFGFPLEICPVGGAYERHPRIFVWNKKYSGLNLHDVNYDHNSEYMELRPITCPYHEWGSRDWLLTVLRRLDERNGSKKQAAEAP